jgi:hypothetical protein
VGILTHDEIILGVRKGKTEEGYVTVESRSLRPGRPSSMPSSSPGT